MAAVQQFLATYVAESDRAKAEGEMCELFVQMHSDLARKFFTEYKQPAQHQMVMNLNEVEEKEVEVPKKKSKPTQKKAVKKICCGVTAKGKPCGNKCFEDGDYCKIHQKVADKAGGSKAETKKKKSKGKEVAKGEKKSKVTKKAVPEHTHGLVEEAVIDDCELCNTHGNALNTELQEAEFELAADPKDTENIQSRLAGILAQFDEEEEEEEEEETQTLDFGKALDSDDEGSDSDETVGADELELDVEEI